MAIKVSLRKKSAAPIAKEGVIQLVHYDDIATWPARSQDDVVVTGNIVLKPDAKAIALEVTAETIDIANDIEGDPDAEGVVQKLVFEHPGVQADSELFFQKFLGKPFIGLSNDCSGEGTRVIGWKCNPIYLSPAGQDNNDGAKTTVTMAQRVRSILRAGFYKGTAIPNQPWNDPSGSTGSGGAGV
ncbi:MULTISPECIES: hypothetical protein [Sphingobacterium]|uniref:hypothetical protein n=1 Tax=Sphingobacterium TaxID=28453 RepID=UPI00257C28AF|nr:MULTISPECIES: hypothetical protein [Sphingobacterium]